MDKNVVVVILSYVVPVVLAWLLRSPLKKWIPSRAAKVIGKLTPENIDKFIKFCTDKDVRRDAAISYLHRLAQEQGIALSDELAGEVVDALALMYRNVVGKLK